MTITGDHWEFYQQSDGRWRWRHIDAQAMITVSPAAYLNRNDCIANAIRHGYMAPADDAADDTAAG